MSEFSLVAPFLDRLEHLGFEIYANRKLVYVQQGPPERLDDRAVSAAQAAARSSGAEVKKNKKPKELQCKCCKKTYKSKDDAWRICSTCGVDTCEACTKLNAEKRLVCDMCANTAEGGPNNNNNNNSDNNDNNNSNNDNNGSSSSALDAARRDSMFFLTNDISVESESSLIVLKPKSRIVVAEDVKVVITHRGKRFVHFWINTRFHRVEGDESSQVTVLTFAKHQLDGSDKDHKCKKFPANFMVQARLRAAGAGDSVTPPLAQSDAAAAAADGDDDSVDGAPASPATSPAPGNVSASGLVREDTGFLLLNKLSQGQYAPNVAGGLLSAAITILQRHGAPMGNGNTGGGHVCSIDAMASVAADLEYVALLSRLSQLGHVRLPEGTAEEHFAFWLNTFHLLQLVSFVESFPFTKKERRENARCCRAHVAGQTLSLYDIEFGILRAGEKYPMLPSSLEVDDEQRDASLAAVAPLVFQGKTAFRPLVTFCISYFASGCPGLTVYSGDKFIKQLHNNAVKYLTRFGCPKKGSNQISNYLEWFQLEEDVGASVAAWSAAAKELGFDKSFDACFGKAGKEFKVVRNCELDEIAVWYDGEAPLTAGLQPMRKGSEMNVK